MGYKKELIKEIMNSKKHYFRMYRAIKKGQEYPGKLILKLNSYHEKNLSLFDPPKILMLLQY